MVNNNIRIPQSKHEMTNTWLKRISREYFDCNLHSLAIQSNCRLTRKTSKTTSTMRLGWRCDLRLFVVATEMQLGLSTWEVDGNMYNLFLEKSCFWTSFQHILTTLSGNKSFTEPVLHFYLILTFMFIASSSTETAAAWKIKVDFLRRKRIHESPNLARTTSSV